MDGVIGAAPRLAVHAPVSQVRAAAAAGVVVGAGVGARSGEALETLVLAGFFGVLAAISVIDLHERRIPNVLTYPAIVVALLVAIASGHMLEAAAGLWFAGGLMGAFWAAGRGALGMGDVKLCAMAGATLGLGGTPLFLVLGTVLGAIVAVVALALRGDRHATLPYGPTLAAGAALAAILEGSVVT